MDREERARSRTPKQQLKKGRLHKSTISCASFTQNQLKTKKKMIKKKIQNTVRTEPSHKKFADDKRPKEVKDILREIKKSVNQNRNLRRLKSHLSKKSIPLRVIKDDRSSVLTTYRETSYDKKRKRNKNKSKSKSRSPSNNNAGRIKNSAPRSMRHYKKLMMNFGSSQPRIKLRSQKKVNLGMSAIPGTKDLSFAGKMFDQDDNFFNNHRGSSGLKGYRKYYDCNLSGIIGNDRTFDFKEPHYLKGEQKSKASFRREQKQSKIDRSVERNENSVRSFREFKDRFSTATKFNKSKVIFKENLEPTSEIHGKSKTVHHIKPILSSKFMTPKEMSMKNLTEKKYKEKQLSLASNKNNSESQRYPRKKQQSFSKYGFMKDIHIQKNFSSNREAQTTSHFRTPSDFSTALNKSKLSFNP